MVHLVARARTGFPLADPSLAFPLWSRLRCVFPDAVACVLMGNHLHLLLQQDDRALRRLRAVIGHTAGWPFDRLPEAQTVRGRDKELRMLRYVLLNPCRAGLTEQPSSWLFSTLRDSLGLVEDAWTDPPLGLSRERMLEHLHRDDRTGPRPRLPAPVADVRFAVRPLGDCVLATQAAFRTPSIRTTAARTAFFQLARRQGWSSASQLAGIAGVSRRAVYTAWSRPDHSLGARRCLSDARFFKCQLPSVRRV